MRLSAQIADAYARAFEYPRADTGASVRVAAAGLRGGSLEHDASADMLEELASWLDGQTLGESEERYTRLFDLKPVATLNLGYHLFGDAYERGALLAGLVREARARGVPYQHDLPDHLPILLRLLGSMDDIVDRRLLVHSLMLPGLKKLNKALKESRGPWPELLRLLPALLKSEVPKGTVDIPASSRRLLEVLPC